LRPSPDGVVEVRRAHAQHLVVVRKAPAVKPAQRLIFSRAVCPARSVALEHVYGAAARRSVVLQTPVALVQEPTHAVRSERDRRRPLDVAVLAKRLVRLFAREALVPVFVLLVVALMQRPQAHVDRVARGYQRDVVADLLDISRHHRLHFVAFDENRAVV